MRKSSWRRVLDGRWAFVAWVLAFLGSNFAAGTHWLAVPHRLCEIHGTIEHARASEAKRPTGPRPAGPIVRELDPKHEECELGPYARTEGVMLARAEARGVFVAEECGSVFAPEAPDVSFPRHLLAPSRSPPV